MVERPILSIPKTNTEKWHDLLSILILLFSIVYLALKWSDLPATIAIHYNGSGVADGWGGKGTMIMFPILLLLFYVGFTLLRKVPPHHFNYPIAITEQNAPHKYKLSIYLISWMKLEVVALFGYLNWAFVQNALGLSSGLGIWMLPVSLVLIFGTIIILLIKMMKP